jgi:SAM-dependent methyltransferase
MGVFDVPENVRKYEAWFSENRAVFESEVAVIRELLPAGIGFEVGIGTGIFAETLGIRMGNDPSEEMLKAARERGRLVYHCKGYSLPQSRLPQRFLPRGNVLFRVPNNGNARQDRIHAGWRSADIIRAFGGYL